VVIPVLVEWTENRIDDPIHAFHVGEHHRRLCSSTNFHEAAVVTQEQIIGILKEGDPPVVTL